LKFHPRRPNGSLSRHDINRTRNVNPRSLKIVDSATKVKETVPELTAKKERSIEGTMRKRNTVTSIIRSFRGGAISVSGSISVGGN
jgi:hypothetical protein